MKNKTLFLFVGHNDKDTHKQEKTTKEIEKIIVETFNAAGVYNLTTGHLKGLFEKEQENTTLVFLFDVNKKTVKKACSVLCEKLNQQCILQLELKAKGAFLS